VSDIRMGDPEIDLAAELRDGSKSLLSTPEAVATMSETSIDGTLLLHSIGMEPIDFVFGVGARSHPYQMWSSARQKHEVTGASQALDAAMGAAESTLQSQALAAGAVGVVGVQLHTEIKVHYTYVELKGTAIRPLKTPTKAPESVFTTCLSARDVVLLHQAGCSPLRFLVAVNFAVVGYQQNPHLTENVELKNLTDALYASREKSVERIQTKALSLGSDGIVGTEIDKKLIGVNTFQVVAFQATGTAIKKRSDRANVDATWTIPMDDWRVDFDVAALRGASSQLLSIRDGSDSTGEFLSDSRSARVRKRMRGSAPKNRVV
jgi:uncharacterized protein YbjQ (UPF0145 family)